MARNMRKTDLRRTHLGYKHSKELYNSGGGGGGGGVRRPSQPFDEHVGQILPENDHGRDGRKI